ncbi:hypothetical protein CY34DRAFT_809990 [Suillus luteus UH-Slu-Lm8-n1]|uniref:Uncharacterized protein n=1 Tax=Suillus luteus UH-Slu-Lm8-n1 TaxID=930992 RepID=A0A0D0A839_9AGAM|nr:hypothetical protein CY34DRAFT_809990 [Suillus luteus UH-Slu-Lm8-n1]
MTPGLDRGYAKRLSGSETLKAEGSEPVSKPPCGVVNRRVQHGMSVTVRSRTNLAGGLSLLEAVEEPDDGV